MSLKPPVTHYLYLVICQLHLNKLFSSVFFFESRARLYSRHGLTDTVSQETRTRYPCNDHEYSHRGCELFSSLLTLRLRLLIIL